MEWGWNPATVASIIIGVLATVIVAIPPVRRVMTPRVRFLEPTPQDNQKFRWWHASVMIEEPRSWLRSQFTKRSIVNCEADVILMTFAAPIFEMHWRSANPNGDRRQSLEYGYEKTIPLAIRAENSQAIFIDAMHNPTLLLNGGEAFITDMNIVHHQIKAEPSRLKPGDYELLIKLKSPQHPRLNATGEYSLHVPADGDSNSQFKLRLIKQLS